MKTYYVADLKNGLIITNETFAVKEFKSLETKNKQTYYKVSLVDKTGEISGNVWNDNLVYIEKGAFTEGNVVMINAMVEEYKGNLQLNIQSASKVDEAQLDEFLEYSNFDIEEMWQSVCTYIEKIEDDEIKNLLKRIFENPEILIKYKTYPAATTVHHTFQGGLIEHVLEMLDLAYSIKKYYPEANYDYVIAGIILHDIGKITELELKGVVTQYSFEGHLIGHLAKSYKITDDYGRGIVSDKKLLLLEHVILSHHGELELGSPIRPSTIEAAIVSMVDYASSQIRIFQHAIKKHGSNDSLFTTRNPFTQTAIYVGED